MKQKSIIKSSPNISKPAITICIPCYKRVNELVTLVESIFENFPKNEFELYFLLNGASDNVTDTVNAWQYRDDVGVIEFPHNIGEEVFLWPIVNLDYNRCWVIGDDDLVCAGIHEKLSKIDSHELVILNYDILCSNLLSVRYSSVLSRYFRPSVESGSCGEVFGRLGHKLQFISCVIIPKGFIKNDSVVKMPKSFSYALAIYESISKNRELRYRFIENIYLKQRGENVVGTDVPLIQKILLDDVREFYLAASKIDGLGIIAVSKNIAHYFKQMPVTYYRIKRNSSHLKAKRLHFVDILVLPIIELVISLVILGSRLWNYLSKRLR